MNEEPKSEFYCRSTMTLVEQSRIRAGYDCKCSGCKAWLEEQKRRAR